MGNRRQCALGAHRSEHREADIADGDRDVLLNKAWGKVVDAIRSKPKSKYDTEVASGSGQ